jgi:hypothetical protein
MQPNILFFIVLFPIFSEYAIFEVFGGQYGDNRTQISHQTGPAHGDKGQKDCPGSHRADMETDTAES